MGRRASAALDAFEMLTGLLLALTTAVLWGLLPIALTVVLARLDPYTITWYRFAASALFLGTVLAATQRLPAFGAISRSTWLLVVIALAALVGNYVLYLVALVHATPTVNQTVSQLAPMFLLLGGLLVFKERFTARQWAGFALLLMGLLLFFNRRLSELRDLSGGLGLGVMLLVIAAISWAAYGLVQKQLLRHLNSQQILWLIYLGAIVVLLPAASPGAVRDLNALQAWMLAFCCLNTLIAYGAFAEALEHLEVSRVSAVLALTPVFTMGSLWIASRFAPGLLEPEGLTIASVAGALLVVGGSALCALGGSGVPALPQPPNGPVTLGSRD